MGKPVSNSIIKIQSNEKIYHPFIVDTPYVQ